MKNEKILTEFKEAMTTHSILVDDLVLKSLEQILNSQPESEKRLQCKHIDVNYFCRECTEGFTNAEIANVLYIEWREWEELQNVVDPMGRMVGFIDWLDKDNQ